MIAPSLSIIITKKTDADETGIYNHIAETFGSIYAGNFRKRLIELFNLVARQPFIGRPANGNISIRVVMLSKKKKFRVRPGSGSPTPGLISTRAIAQPSLHL